MCDTMVVLDGRRVLFAKSSDRDPNEAQVLEWHTRRTNEPGERVRCTWIEIDETPETNAVLLSRPFWMWGAEMGANEHGVVIGNEAVFTTEPAQPVGLTGMDLLRLALERASSAADAVGVITALLERHGQGGGCGHEHRDFSYHSSFLVADPAEAFVLETAGRHWATEHVTHGARSISNGLTIDGFAEAYSQRIRPAVARCRTRRAITEAAARRAGSAGDLMAVLRDHGTGGPTPRYSLLAGGMSAPCMHAGGLAAGSQTTASWVAVLDADVATHWVTATAAPCTGLFKPVRVDEPLDLGPEPVDRFDGRCLWWRHELLHRRVLANPAALAGRFASERATLESTWLADPPSPGEAFAQARRALDRWVEAAWRDDVPDTRPRWVRRYWDVRNRRAGFPTTGVPGPPVARTP